jgi:parallel beta-helix repeat protein
LRSTGVAAITAGTLLFLSNLFGEFLLPAEKDGEIVRLGLFLVYVAAYGLGAAALVLALRGLAILQRRRGVLTRAGHNGLRVAAAGAALQALFAAVYFATAAATGDAAEAAFLLFALGFLLLTGGSLTAGVSMTRTGVQRPVGALLLVAAVAAIVTIVTPAPVHDVGLFLFDAAWIGVGLAVTRQSSPVSMKRVATIASIVALAATLVPSAEARGTEPPTDVRCGETITTDTTLDSDLMSCPGSGIVIGADNLTLDLNGHTLEGTGGGAGIDNSAGHDGVRIEQGTVTGFDAGILLIGASGNRVQNLTISDNAGAGIALIQSSRNRVEHNSASANGFDGIFLFDSSTRNVVRKNSTSGNGIAGIAVLDGSNDNRIEHNVAASNGVDGIGLGGVAGNRIESNSARGNGVVGIVLEAANGNRVKKNLVSGNDLFGVILSGSDANHVVANVAAGNGIAGILLEASGKNRIEKNTVSLSDSGIAIVGASAENALVKNAASRNATDGILVDNTSHGTLVERNLADGNGDDGIDLDSPASTAGGNRADENGDLGIEAEPGVTDETGNKASGNGNPAQCTNVACR